VSLNIERVWRRTATIGCMIGLAGILWTSCLWYEYQRTLPRRPDPVTRRVYPLNVHGIVVYQTRDERNWLDEIQYSSIAVFAASALIGALHQKKFGRPPTPPSNRFGQTGRPRL
jgi:hypothetical protein